MVAYTFLKFYICLILKNKRLIFILFLKKQIDRNKRETE